MLEEIKKLAESDFNAKLVAVSKTKPIEAIHAMYQKNQRVFGENRVQEMVEKYEALPKDIEWHLIGTLQKNKVKYIAPFVYMIHSCDNLDLIKTIDKEAIKNKRKIKILLQLKIAEEDTKYGYSEHEIKDAGLHEQIKKMGGVEVCGLMGMASFVDDPEQVRHEFSQLKRIFEVLKASFYKDNTSFCEISMGMSGDYKIALEEGATMVRIGSAIFGNR